MKERMFERGADRQEIYTVKCYQVRTERQVG